MRVSYIGITLAFQANEVGSIPSTRSTDRNNRQLYVSHRKHNRRETKRARS